MRSQLNKNAFIKLFLVTILLMTSAVTLSCSLDSYAPDEHFFIKTNGAILPVWVMRNKKSNVFIIHNHGGMGTSYYKTYYEAYQNLRQDYNIVFFSQRGVESSQGNPPLDSFNWDQFTKDLDLVIETTRLKYNPDYVFVQGYSWTGYLVKRYLSNPVYHAKIAGYIDLCGMSYDMENQYQLVQTKVLSETLDPKVINWIAQHPEANLENYLKLVDFADALTPQKVWDDWDEQMKKTALHYGAASPVNIFSWLINSSQKMIKSEKWNRMNRAMFSEKVDVSGITVPTLIISGAYDYDCNNLVGDDFYNAIGTLPADKEHYVFPNSGHFPDLNEPGLFTQVVSDFIERNR